MSQIEIVAFLQQNKNTLYSAFEISKHLDIRETSCSKSLASLRKTNIIKYKILRMRKSGSKTYVYWVQ